MINIYKASLKDTVLISELAKQIYQEHYLHLWNTGGAQWYMDEYAYALDKIETELTDANVEYFIAVEDGTYLGYLKIILNSTWAGDETLAALEVERIYLHKAAMGKGLGKKLMQVALNKALQLKKDIVFLKAMDSATSAIEFYKKLGYIIFGSFELPLPLFSLMKKEYRGMLVLKKEVGNQALPILMIF